MLTVDRLRELLDYDAASGVLTWKVRRKGHRGIKPGRVAGTPHTGRYVSIRIDGKAYLAHRLVWLYVTGEWPKLSIDHIDGDKLNNRFNNLRDVTQAINSQNIRRPRRTNKVGVLGAASAGKNYQVIIGIDYGRRYIGKYATPDQAHAAYVKAKRELHPGGTL